MQRKQFTHTGTSSKMTESISVSYSTGIMRIVENFITYFSQINSASDSNNKPFIVGGEVPEAHRPNINDIIDRNQISHSVSNDTAPTLIQHSSASSSTSTRIISSLNASSDEERPVAISPSSSEVEKLEKPDDNLVAYSKHFQAYISGFKNKEKISNILNELKLTPEEEELFSKFIDPITFEYMDIPVSLNETYYNFETIRHLAIDPLTREAFNPLELQSARNLVNEIENYIKKVKDDRLKASEHNLVVLSNVGLGASKK